MRTLITAAPDSTKSLSIPEIELTVSFAYTESDCEVHLYTEANRPVTLTLAQGSVYYYKYTASYNDQTHVIHCDPTGKQGLDPTRSVDVYLEAKPAASGPNYTVFGSLVDYEVD